MSCNIKSPLHIIIKPFNGEEYVRKSKSGIITTTSIEDHNFTQRLAEVVIVPEINPNNIKKGDIIIVHHNTFRTQYSNQGVERPSMYYIKDDLYYIEEGLYYGVVDGDNINMIDTFCMVEPIVSTVDFEGVKEIENTGKIIYMPKWMRKNGLKENSTVFFKNDSEYEFNILDKKLYLMKTKRILSWLN